ncbi:helix-turn-helix domain-containing protein [Geitlerinema splendidum]|nr:helix-turn-helix domain-containing protein [Geitlerinema splendidum]
MASYNLKIEEGSSPRERTTVTAHPGEEQVSVIRKEFVALTGDHFSAVVLNQLMYWTQRVRDFDLLLKEERTFRPNCNVPPRHGWIYKTAHDLIEETMLGISHPTMRKYLKVLIDRGWIDERAHPIDKWNKTTQYRVNLRKLQEDLMAIGRNLPLAYLKAFPSSLLEEALPQPTESSDLQSNVRNFHSNERLEESLLPSSLESKEISNVKILHSNVENFHSDVKNLQSNVRNLHSYTYTENTPKTTNREHAEGARENSDKSFFEEVLEIWNTYVNQEELPPAHLTNERRRRIYSLFPLYFESDLTKWKQFCERVSCSPFLMGQGLRKWRVSLDWILVEENLIKVLEGNFDDPTGIEQKQTVTNNTEKTKEISKILAAIEDPVWRKWCSQLDLESRDAVSLGELKSIANARFLEIEGDRLVWIGSSDPQVLSRIEDLRLKLLPLAQKTFPKVRNLRTRLCEEHSVTQKEIPQQLGELS